MTTNRSAPYVKRQKLPDGRWPCQHCGQPCLGRRTSYCQDSCAEEYSIRNFPAYARGRVFERDRGICALCGLDTEKLAASWHKREFEIQTRMGNGPGHRRYKHLPRWADDSAWAVLERERMAYFALRLRSVYEPRTRYRGSPWEMDHIIPVVEGGGQCGLDNLRTLCVPCHRYVTAELWKRLAKPRLAEPERPERVLTMAMPL